jgi:hypothetical protein
MSVRRLLLALRMKNRNAIRLADGLGWFSIALGLGELLLPKRLGRVLGLGHRPGLLVGYGFREIGTGVLLLVASSRRKRPWVIGRIAGDVLDILTLAPKVRPGSSARRGAAVALASVLGVTALDVRCAAALPG